VYSLVEKYEAMLTFKPYLLRDPQKLRTEKVASELWSAAWTELSTVTVWVIR